MWYCASVELLWAPRRAALRASEGAQRLCPLTEQRKPPFFEKENIKELPEVLASHQTEQN